MTTKEQEVLNVWFEQYEKRWLKRLSKLEDRTMNAQIRYMMKKYIIDNYPDMLSETEEVTTQ